MALSVLSSTSATASAAASITFAIDCTGADCLVARCSVNSPTKDLSATYNGAPMTRASQIQNATTDATVAIFVLPSPASGSHNVVISVNAGTVNFGAGADAVAGSAASPIGADNSSNQASNSAPSVSLTTTTDGSLVFDIGTAGGGNTAGTTATVTGTNQTQSFNNDGISRRTFGGYMTTTNAMAYTPSWSLSAAAPTTMIAVEVKPAVPAVRPARTLVGVGQ
jgi:hypothetical protein